MSETNAPVVETKTNEDVGLDYKALYEKAQSDIVKIAAKKDELLNETKKAKQDREAAELAHKKATEDKAQKDGEFETLWQTAKREKEELVLKLAERDRANRNEKVQISAMRIATELADGDNAELLSEFVQRNLDKIADEAGALSADVLEAVRNEFKNNDKYRSLLRGSKAVGGGATGNTQTKLNTKTITRSEFDSLDQSSRRKFLSGGGKLVETN